MDNEFNARTCFELFGGTGRVYHPILFLSRGGARPSPGPQQLSRTSRLGESQRYLIPHPASRRPAVLGRARPRHRFRLWMPSRIPAAMKITTPLASSQKVHWRENCNPPASSAMLQSEALRTHAKQPINDIGAPLPPLPQCAVPRQLGFNASVRYQHATSAKMAPPIKYSVGLDGFPVCPPSANMIFNGSHSNLQIVSPIPHGLLNRDKPTGDNGRRASAVPAVSNRPGRKCLD
jgi:hypothetical protein